MDDDARRKLLGLVGLGARARKVVIGVDLVRSAAQRGRLALVVLASDMSRHSRAKVVPLVTAKKIECVDGPTGSELGAAVGKDVTAAIGVIDEQLAKGIRAAVSAAVKAV